MRVAPYDCTGVLRRPRARLSTAFLLAATSCAALSCAAGRESLDVAAGDVAAVELRLVEDERGRPEAIDAVGLEPALLDRLRRVAASRDEWALVFPVAGEAADSSAAAVAGDYVVTAEAVRFLPRTPFVRGQRYRASWVRQGEDLAELEFAPHRAGPDSTVRAVAIYPTSDVLPVNLRRLYIEFSGPMRRGEAHRHVRMVRDPGGEPVALPWPSPEQEQWNEPATQLTLVLDPQPPDAGASPLEIGKRYRLIVERTWPDRDGTPIRDGLDKLFLVDEPDREGSSPESWTITPPISRQAPLLVEMPSPLDYALLANAIEVRRRDGAALEGRARISDSETRWTFQPDAGWSSGPYVLRIDAGLEDPSGNAAGGAAAREPGAAPEDRARTVLPFEVELRPVPSTAQR